MEALGCLVDDADTLAGAAADAACAESREGAALPFDTDVLVGLYDAATRDAALSPDAEKAFRALCAVEARFICADFDAVLGSARWE